MHGLQKCHHIAALSPGHSELAARDLVTPPQAARGLVTPPQAARGLFTPPQAARGLVTPPQAVRGPVSPPQTARGLVTPPQIARGLVTPPQLTKICLFLLHRRHDQGSWMSHFSHFAVSTGFECWNKKLMHPEETEIPYFMLKLASIFQVEAHTPEAVASLPGLERRGLTAGPTGPKLLRASFPGPGFTGRSLRSGR